MRIREATIVVSEVGDEVPYLAERFTAKLLEIAPFDMAIVVGVATLGHRTYWVEIRPAEKRGE